MAAAPHAQATVCCAVNGENRLQRQPGAIENLEVRCFLPLGTAEST